MKLSDPWGFGWRAKNLVKRFSFRQTWNLCMNIGRDNRFERPIFIVGAPRSGTTTLFHLLREHSELAALKTEGHNLWRTFHHPRSSKWHSDYVGAEEASSFQRRYSDAYFRTYAAYHPKARRLVEKTPENTLRIGYLRAMYPDAIFVHLKRNPGDVLNSMINGWNHPEGKFRSYFVPPSLRIPNYDWKHQWCFTLIPGWKNLIAEPVEKIVLQQWIAMTEHLLEGRRSVPDEQWIELNFEDMVDPNSSVLDELCDKIGVELSSDLRRNWDTILSNPRNSLSAPGVGKWRSENGKLVGRMLPGITNLAAELGYRIEANGDTFNIERSS